MNASILFFLRCFPALTVALLLSFCAVVVYSQETSVEVAPGSDIRSLPRPETPDFSVASQETRPEEHRDRLRGAAARMNEDATRITVNERYSKDLSSLLALLRATEIVERFYTVGERNIPGAKEWREYLEMRLLREDINGILATLQSTESESTGVAPISIKANNLSLSDVADLSLIPLCERANKILARLNDPRLTPIQKRIIRTPSMFQWKAELEKWTADTIDSDVLLQAVEQYEKSPGAKTMRTLADTIERLSRSPNDSSRALGTTAGEIYHGANIKIFVSEALINHLLPKQDVRYMNFRDVIANQPVVGRGRNESELKISMVPHPSTLLFSLDVSGKVASKNRSSVLSTTLFSDNYAQYFGQKKMAWTEKGVELAPAQVAVNRNRVRLQGIRTDGDGVPFFSGLVREVIRSQFEARGDQIRWESRQRVTREVRSQLDKETEERFGEINKQYREAILRPLEDIGLSLENKGSATDEHWLLSSWQLSGTGVLGGHTTAPATLAGAFADLKIHESALAAFFQRLDIDGKTMSIGELRRLIGEKIGQPALFGPGEHDDAVISFAEEDPIIVRFVDGKIELRLAIAMLDVDDRVFHDFGVRVQYEPQHNEAGHQVLARSGIVRFTGSNIKLAQRLIFGKIFPEQRPIELQPALFQTDSRFEGLATGSCRIQDGWFALALVALPENHTGPGVSAE